MTKRLFEAATLAEWQAAETEDHSDVWQALRHMQATKEEIVSIPYTQDGAKLEQKRKTIRTYAYRLGLSVLTRRSICKTKLMIRNVTAQRKASGQRTGRLKYQHIEGIKS